MSFKKNPPGSKEAILNGCKCPVIDNGHGRGAYLDEDQNPVFWFSSNCPLHCNEIHVDRDTLLLDIDT